MLFKDIQIKFEIEPTNLEQYVNQECFDEFVKFVRNYMIDKINKSEYEKADVAKEILSTLYYLKWKKSWLSI